MVVGVEFVAIVVLRVVIFGTVVRKVVDFVIVAEVVVLIVVCDGVVVAKNSVVGF